MNYLKAIVATLLVLCAGFVMVGSANAKPFDFNYLRDYYASIQPGCDRSDCGQLGILEGYEEDRGKVMVIIQHPCATKGNRNFLSPPFKANGRHFSFRREGARRKIVVRGVFRNERVKGMVKLADSSSGCHTGKVGFNSPMWTPPPQ